jgi:PTS system mannose-specific IID component/fructoselysine and glucoselysine-specific PTS system IID component
VSEKLTRWDLARVCARLLFLQATVHPRGMQNIGLMHALDAAAPRLSSNGTSLLARHAEYFNTNPHLAPLVVGGVLRIEEEAESAGPASVSRFKHAAASALAAAGDVFFSGALKPLALTLACLSAIYSFFTGLVAILILYNAAVMYCRYRGITLGYARGWGLVDTFSGPGVPRLLGIARGVAAFAGGLLAGSILSRARTDGSVTVAILVAVAGLAWFGARRGITAPRIAAVLFPVSWVLAMVLK